MYTSVFPTLSSFISVLPVWCLFLSLFVVSLCLVSERFCISAVACFVLFYVFCQCVAKHSRYSYLLTLNLNQLLISHRVLDYRLDLHLVSMCLLSKIPYILILQVIYWNGLFYFHSFFILLRFLKAINVLFKKNNSQIFFLRQPPILVIYRCLHVISQEKVLFINSICKYTIINNYTSIYFFFVDKIFNLFCNMNILSAFFEKLLPKLILCSEL